MTVLKPGSSVRVDGEIPGRISSVAIRSDGGVSYHVTWWDGRKRSDDWFDREEIAAGEDAKSLTIGFRA